MKPKLRKEFEMELRGAVSAIIRSQLIYNNDHPYQSCLSCTHFYELTEICKLANQRPPAKIIVYGCPQYEDNQEVPF